MVPQASRDPLKPRPLPSISQVPQSSAPTPPRTGDVSVSFDSVENLLLFPPDAVRAANFGSALIPVLCNAPSSELVLVRVFRTS